VNSKQDIVCTEEKFEDKHNHVPGYVRQRVILREVESHKERRLKKLRNIQKRIKNNSNSQESLCNQKEGER